MEGSGGWGGGAELDGCSCGLGVPGVDRRPRPRSWEGEALLSSRLCHRPPLPSGPTPEEGGGAQDPGPGHPVAAPSGADRSRAEEGQAGQPGPPAPLVRSPHCGQADRPDPRLALHPLTSSRAPWAQTQSQPCVAREPCPPGPATPTCRPAPQAHALPSRLQCPAWPFAQAALSAFPG